MDGSKAFCFVNGPFKQMGEILRKILWEQADCVLIALGWPKTWVSMLRALPIARTVKVTPDSLVTTGRARTEPMFVRGSRASQDAPLAHWILYGHLIEFSAGKTENAPATSSTLKPARGAMVRDCSVSRG